MTDSSQHNDSRAVPGGAHVVVIGLGNIGTSLLGHILRLPEIGRLTLIDPDRYAPSNLADQLIDRGDVGRAKARAGAARARRLRPDLGVEAIVARVEDVPLGRLRCDALLTCLDSRAPRCHVNQIARWLGIPWLDSGIEASGLLVRLTVLRPAPCSPCFECGWHDEDYAVMTTVRPCTGAAPGVAPTGAPSSLGGLAAAMQALELQKILGGDWDRVAVDRQVTISAADHVHFVSSLRADPQCRCDHRRLETLPLATTAAELTVESALALAPAGDGVSCLEVPGREFLRTLACRGCGERRSILRVNRSSAQHEARCRCGSAMEAVGFDRLSSLAAADLSPGRLRRPLSRLGFRAGDVFTARRGQDAAHYELPRERAPRSGGRTNKESTHAR